MKPNDIHPAPIPDMSLDTNVVHSTARPNRRPINVFWFWLIMILAILYVISPIDLLPDVIPIVGWVDDVVVVLTAVSIALPKIIKHYQAR